MKTLLSYESGHIKAIQQTKLALSSHFHSENILEQNEMQWLQVRSYEPIKGVSRALHFLHLKLEICKRFLPN